MSNEMWRLTAVEQAAAVRTGDVSAVALTERHLARIAEVNPVVNAVTQLLAERALADAAAVDRNPTGPLAGVPVTVKESIAVGGVPTTHGAARLRNLVAAADAPPVARLRAAGAVIVGHTNMPTLTLAGMHSRSELFGDTVNPWHPARTPGGSSGGDAVAVATGMAAVRLGNDAGGPWIADERLAALVREAAAQPVSAVPDPVTLRGAARARAAARRPGPAMTAEDRRLDGVPVRVYQPGSAVTVVYLHGGGFVFGDLETHDAQVRRLAAATGTTVVAVDYRRAPEHPWPAAIDDAVAVIRQLYASTGPVALAGDSAGGLIAIQAALRLRDETPFLAQLLICPNTDLSLSSPSMTTKGAGWLLDAAALRQWRDMWLPDPELWHAPSVDPAASDLRGLPPALIVTAEHDPLRDEGEAYAARLRHAGVEVRHRREPGLVHNFPTLRDVSPAAAAAEDRFLAAAAAFLSGGPATLPA
ncbi:alpha/beta fold hydrolase [Actinoplanes sp. NPDC051851]|uniref:alpha/beta fold hydrolase n=1 Tax=Actinoplanes sp. NPDC051851 TaxID=3154753 RepID=UPI00343CA6CF